MSWEKLKSALQDMPPTGEKGFEGLVARLLSELLGETFVLARSGDQPSGDGRNMTGTISFQAKRYGDKTPINAKELEGDIRTAIRTLPELQVFLVALTRPATAQLQTTLDSIERDTGIDILVLELASESSALVTLCLAFWDSISHFEKLSDLSDKFAAWVRKQKKSQETIKTLLQLRQNIGRSLQSYAKTRDTAIQLLRRRFSFGDRSPTICSEIDLSTAVRRPKIESAIANWWRTREEKVSYLEGEEGTGKTWAVALSVQRLSEEANMLVLWLDSFDWCECRSLSDVVSTALRKIGITDERKLGLLNHKALNVWENQILIVLDGVNERHALEAANSILCEYLHHSTNNLRILLTTRPIKQYPRYVNDIWKKCRNIQIGPFDDDEFDEALRSIDKSLSPSMISESLQSIARIPRYFQTCISLRHKLGPLSNITKEIVLWEDLKDRIEKTDPQVRQKLGWQSENDAVEILSTLARNAEHQNSGPHFVVSQEFMNRCFDNKYQEIRNDLQELRITERAPILEARISPHHLVLGWALYLHETLGFSSRQDIRELSDELRRTLEPLTSEDHRIESLFVALQLSALRPEKLGDQITTTRAALLYCWILSHNADITKERLNFWLGEDPKAYLLFLEALYESLRITSDKPFAIAPLARLWKDKGAENDVIARYVRKWLLFVWSDEIDPEKNEISYQGHCLPVAKNPAQLRLSREAIWLLSLRADPSFLETLALCQATLPLSCRKDGDRKHREKSLEQMIGILMRWGFTEEVIPAMESLATNSDTIICEGTRILASYLALEQLPYSLRSAKKKERLTWNFVSASEIIKDQKTLFPTDEDSPRCSHLDMRRLAIRTDLPDLLSQDKDKIKSIVLDICKNENPHYGEFNTETDYNLNNYWAWFVRFFPELSAEVANELRLKSLDYENPTYLLQFLSNAAHSVPSGIRQQIVGKSKIFLARAIQNQSEKQIRALLV